MSNVVKNAEKLCHLLNDMVEQIGEANVVQAVTDSAYNYVAAGIYFRFLISYSSLNMFSNLINL